MPIAIACACGKKGKVKDDLAGKKVRCPECSGAINVPPMLSLDAEDDIPFAVEVADPPERSKSADRRPAAARAQEFAVKPRRTYDEDETEPRPKPKKPKKKKVDYDALDLDRHRRPREGVVFEEGWFGSLNSGVIGGLLTMAFAALWFFGGLAIGYIFFYAPILFFIGLVATIKGLFNQ